MTLPRCFVLFLGLTLSCGTALPEPTPVSCGPSNCNGCCSRASFSDLGTCVTTRTASACGAAGDSCVACTDGKSCVSNACDYVPDSLPVGAKTLFITSATYQGDLGGIAGADSKCQAAAAGVGLTGSWKAWISDRRDGAGATRPVVNAIDRITAAGPWYLTCRDQRKLLIKAFNNKAQLQSVPLVTLGCTENGTFLGVGEKTAWTGTSTGGTAATEGFIGESANCDAWSSIANSRKGRMGLSTTAPADWTDFVTSYCWERAHLYCFQN